jgi:YfiH family protein
MRYLDGVENRRRDAFFSSLGLDPAFVLGTELFHSRRVLLVRPSGQHFHGPLPTEGGSHDGILVEDGTLAACITVADCMPIWLYDTRSGAFGVLHSGWKGTGILEVAVRSLAATYGSPPEAMSAILGPAIGACCYGVPEERAAAFAAEFGSDTVSRDEGGWRLDLRAANLGLARRLGLGAVLSVEACTSCDPRLGSYRREGKDAFTRMAAVAAHFPEGSPRGSLVLEPEPM